MPSDEGRDGGGQRRFVGGGVMELRLGAIGMNGGAEGGCDSGGGAGEGDVIAAGSDFTDGESKAFQPGLQAGEIGGIGAESGRELRGREPAMEFGGKGILLLFEEQF